jgi:hypothetical protein
MLIATTAGTFEASDLEIEVGGHDTPEAFYVDYRYRKRGESQVIAHYRRLEFKKVNPFEETPAEVSTPYGLRDPSTFEKTLSQVDNENEFTCRVEYREPVSGAIAHSSAYVRLKTIVPAAQSQAGGI